MWLILLCGAVVILPGLLVARAAGLTGWTGIGAAPMVSYGIAATAGPLSWTLGIRWGPATMLTATVVLACVCWATQRRFPPGDLSATDVQRAPVDRQGDRVIAAGVLAAAVLGAVVVMRGIGGLAAVHQGWDAGFHANAIRFITETGNPTPGALSAINNYEDATFFYPNGQHVLTSVVGQLSGSPVPSLLNAQMVLLPGIAGLGLAVLVRAFGGRVALAASVPLVLVSFTGFPYDVLSRGPLLPYATGIAMVPAFLVLLHQALVRRTVTVVLLTAVCAAALLAVHPSTAVTAAIFTIPLLIHRWRAGRPEARRRDVGTLLGVGLVAVAAGLPYVLGTISIGESGASVDWPARQNPWEATTGLLLLNHRGDGSQYWLVALFAVGAFHLRRIRRLWWFLAGAALFAVLFVTVSSTDAALTETLTQPWWNDRWRLLALVILGQALLAAHGAVIVGEALVGLVRRRVTWRIRTTRASVGMAMVVVLAVFALFSNSFYAPLNERAVSLSYQGGPTVTPSVQTAMRALAEMTGSEGRVMNDPGDGSVWMYALEEVRPIFGHVIDPENFGSVGADQQLLLTSFNCVDSSLAIRELVQKYDIRYVFTGRAFLRVHFFRIPGLRHLDLVHSLQLVYNRDGIAIYRVRLDVVVPASAAELTCGPAGLRPTQPRIAAI